MFIETSGHSEASLKQLVHRVIRVHEVESGLEVDEPLYSVAHVVHLEVFAAKSLVDLEP